MRCGVTPGSTSTSSSHVSGWGLSKQGALPNPDLRRDRHSEEPNFDVLDGTMASFRTELAEGWLSTAGRVGSTY
jgi:hypothetical protein